MNYFEGEDERLKQQLGYHRAKQGKVTAKNYRLDKHEDQRVEWGLRLDENGQANKMIHELQWQLRNHKINIAELQKILSDGHLSLFQQRELFMRLKLQNDNLKLIDHQNRQKLLELAALQDSNDVCTSSKLNKYKDCRPSMTQVKSKKALAIQASLNQSGKNLRTSKNSNISALKAIFLPNEDINRKRVQLQQIRQLQEMKTNVYQAHIAAIQRDCMIREEEMKLKERDFQSKESEILERLRTAQKKAHQFNTQYFDQKHKATQKEHQLKKGQNELQEESNRLSTMKENVNDKIQYDLDYEKKKIIENSKKYQDKFRKQAQQREDRLSILKKQYQKQQEEFIQESRILNIRKQQININYSKLEEIRNRQIADFSAQVSDLRLRMKHLEAYTKKLKKLVDQDDPKLAQVLDSEESQSLDFDGMARDLHKIQTSLNEARTHRYLKVLKRNDNNDIIQNI